MEKILKELKEAGYDYGVAIATQAEINAGAACGQLSLVLENENSEEQNSLEWVCESPGGHHLDFSEVRVEIYVFILKPSHGPPVRSQRVVI